jgi:uracil DNA glycosylase superfamily protein
VNRIRPSKKTDLQFRKRLRRSFRPKRVRVLFVGESPPASGRFFYHADSGLYRAIREAFMKAFPDLREADFLESFRGMGCYLVDLCERPVDRLKTKARRAACLAGEPSLSRTLGNLRPQVVIAVVRSIAENVTRSEHRAGWTGTHVELPYPGRWIRHRKAFVEELGRLLPGWKLDGVKSGKGTIPS